MSLIIRIIVVFLILMSSAMFGFAILQPLAEAPKRSKRKTQFFLSDLFSLILLLQIPLAFFAVVAHQYPHDMSTGMVGFAVGLNSLGVALPWWLAVRFLSGRGIDDSFRRIVCIAVIFPVAILGSCATMGVISWALLPLVAPADYPATSSAKLRAWAAVLMIPFVCYLFRKLTYWVLSGAKRP